MHLTSSAVNGLPSCHLTPSRNLKVSSVPSSLHAQLGGELGDDRLHAVLRNVLIEDHEIVEDPHHRHDDADRPLLVDRHAGRAVAMIDPQCPALLLGQRRIGAGQPREQHGRTRRVREMQLSSAETPRCGTAGSSSASEPARCIVEGKEAYLRAFRGSGLHANGRLGSDCVRVLQLQPKK